MDLFSYPRSPGCKERGGTSQAAAERIMPRVGTLRDRALEALKRAYPGALSADQVAVYCDATVLAMRPRITELYQLGLIEKTEYITRNASGVSARKWRFRP